ncbi:MAG: hypothetical protein UX39_C0005G0008 [Candidatus Magasanikbacteria bacterium GW2011_GWA2_46_17]|uniref:Peptidoglycan binding-like domain-containing protein n=1 Tax=Candidatus Magasanikbacteria bacterium GW2011_GWA2_46_17 TaxID=1619042 RepID=A0A0G1S180_9BACT|nr:MAG: hypothetical protein UX39_C0005G0008 [Candidatus Magasanikbacteria bacterium GW2011_GWA2_46_17]
MYQLKKSKTKQFVAGLIGASLALSLAFAVTVKADTVSDLTAQINSLLATITSLQTKLAAVQGSSTTTTTTSDYTFSSDLSVGSKGADVMNLQKVLNMSPDTQVASGSSAGAPGYETSTFGPATKAAVIKFQKKNGVSGTGYVGPLTRGVLNSMSSTSSSTSTTTTTTTTTTSSVPGCTGTTGFSPTTGQACSGSTTTTTTTAPSGTGLTVSSPVQPAVTIAPYKASRVPFTKITLTAGSDGDVTVNSLTVQRTGLATDAAFASIVLLDENGLQIGTSKTFNSNHQTTLGDPFVVSRGTSRTLTVAGNMETSAGGYGGQVASLTVVGVNTSATVSGSLPITGAGQTVNETLTLGTATLYVSQYDPASNLTKNIGDTAVKFSGIKVTAGSAEDVTLWSVRWNQTGSAGATDLANIVTILDGTTYPTIISADGKYYTTLFPNGIIIQKGFSKDLHVQGDIIGAASANRTIEFDLYNASDLYVSGNTYNFGITGAANTTGTLSATSRSKFTTSTPFYGGSIVTINAGTVTTIGKSSTIAPAKNIAVNVPNQILGAYDTNVKGEPISVQTTVIHFTSSAAGLGTLTSVSLLDKNGAVVAGPADAALVTGTDQKVTFTDTITYPIGVGTFTIVGKLPTSYTDGSTINASTTPSSDWSTVKGQTTGNTLTLTNAVFSMNTMTIRRASLAVGASSVPAARTIVAGAQDFVFTNFQFDATQSGEDVRISTIPAHLTYTVGAGTDISSCRLFDGATNLTTGSNVVNPTTTASSAAYTFTLDSSLTIPKGTVKTISVKCNVSGAATSGGIFAWVMSSTDVGTTLSVTGTTSTGSVTATGSATGANMTVGSATLAAAGDTTNTSYTIASAGTTGVVVAGYKFTATNDDIDLRRLVLKLTNTASSSDTDIVLVHIFDGNTEVAPAVTFTGGATLATTTLTVPTVIARGTQKVLTVKVDLAGITNDAAAGKGSGHLLNIDIDNNDSTGTYGSGVGSGVQVNSTGSTAVTSTGIRIFKSYPKFASVTGTGALPQSGVADGRLIRFSVTADSKGPVNIAKFLVTIATSTITSVNTVNMFAFNTLDASGNLTGPVAGVNTGGQLLTTSVSTAVYPSSPTIAIYPQTTAGATTTIQIGVGSTMYFEVRGTVTGVTTGSSVVTTLKGDTGYPQVSNTYFMPTVVIADAGANIALNSFIWSPNSTTTSPSVNDVDWSNGYALPGLPSNGIIQSRTN